MNIGRFLAALAALVLATTSEPGVAAAYRSIWTGKIGDVYGDTTDYFGFGVSIGQAYSLTYFYDTATPGAATAANAFETPSGQISLTVGGQTFDLFGFPGLTDRSSATPGQAGAFNDRYNPNGYVTFDSVIAFSAGTPFSGTDPFASFSYDVKMNDVVSSYFFYLGLDTIFFEFRPEHISFLGNSAGPGNGGGPGPGTGGGDAVPEPPMLALIGVGAVLLGWRRSRRD